MNFRIGDVVIKVNGHPGDIVKVGEVATVIVNPNGRERFTIRMSNGEWWTSNPDNYELEYIYNSPLAKALR